MGEQYVAPIQAASTFHELWFRSVAACLDGETVSPRGMEVREVPLFTGGFVLTDTSRPFICSRVRRANYRFGLMEACWILGGLNDLETIGQFNKQMRRYSDNGTTLWGAYGPRLIGQLSHVVETLRRDPDSRQAILQTWRPQTPPVTARIEDRTALAAAGVSVRGPAPPEWDGASHRSKDIPCTVTWHFMIRDGALHLMVYMRSNDVWLGMPYDVLTFTTVQRVVAALVGVQPGWYHHRVGSLHIYKRHYGIAVAALENRDPYRLEFPVMPDPCTVYSPAHTVEDVAQDFSGVILGDPNVADRGGFFRPFIDAYYDNKDGLYGEVQNESGR